jgi:hypothetical protein
MLITILDIVEDKYLTWKTGLPKADRDYVYWKDRNIVQNAGDANNYFYGYKFVFTTDYAKVFTEADIWGLCPNADFLSYMWPKRPLGNHCYYNIFRGEWNQHDHRFHFTEFGTDELFVATNSEEDAMMLLLKYA